MKAWILDQSPGSYRWGDVEEHVLADDDVRVRVVTSALNHMDLWLTKGLPKPPLPHVPGCDVAGVVEKVGASVTGVSVGDEVAAYPGVSPLSDIIELGDDSPVGRGFRIVGEHRWGGHATHITVPARNVVPRPAGRTWEECAAYPIAYVTALRMLRRARAKAGDTVLVVGIGSGVSCAALALARHLGCRVEVTSRDPEKREQALQMGAAAAHDSADTSWPVKAHVVIESVGPATWEQSMRSLRPAGRLVVCGGTSGQQVQVNLPRLFYKQYEIIGSTMGSYREFHEATDLVADGVPVHVDAVYPVDRYEDALARLASGRQLGKIVLRHGED